MEASLIESFGGPELVTTKDIALREPLPDEVVVRVEAAGVNPLDLKIIAGYMQQVFPVALPYVPGTDFSGTVEVVGANVIHLKRGDRVVGRTSPNAGGAFASKLIIAASSLCVMPGDMSFEQAAALPTALGTARHALFDIGRLQPGERVLIHAAAGGVGSMAVQLAHHAGAYVIATASGRNIEHVRMLGADKAIDYRSEDFTSLRDIDLVLDPIGGETLERSWQVLGEGGRIATLVNFAIEARDGHAGDFVFFSDAAAVLPEAMHMFRADRLQIVVDSVFPLAETRSVLERVAMGHARGKVLVRMSDA